MKGLGRTIAVTICIGLVVISTSGRGTETQKPGCSFTISGTLVARPGSDRDTLGFAGSTFNLEIQAAGDVKRRVETRTQYDREYKYYREYKVVTFDLTSPTALVWKPSGSPFDDTYRAPVKLVFINDQPWWPGVPDTHDGILFEAQLDIGGNAYKLRMDFAHNQSQLFDENELGDICIFRKSGSAHYINQWLERVPDYSAGFYGLRVEDFEFTSSP